MNYHLYLFLIVLEAELTFIFEEILMSLVILLSITATNIVRILE